MTTRSVTRSVTSSVTRTIEGPGEGGGSVGGGGGGGDTTAPVLSSQSLTADGQNAVDLAVSTDEDNGTLFYFLSTSGTAPSVANLKAGTGAVESGSVTVSATGAQTIPSISGLDAATTYHAYFLHTDDADNDSDIVTDSATTDSPPVAASEGPNNPGSAVVNTSFGSINWSNPTRILSSNNSRSTAFSVSGTTRYLLASNFGFSIPSGATIDGITVRVERRNSTGGFVSDSRVRIVKGGAIGSTNKTVGGFWPISDGVATYGGDSDLWGESWTPADINASNFGVAIAASMGIEEPPLPTAEVDNITIEVDYTA